MSARARVIAVAAVLGASFGIGYAAHQPTPQFRTIVVHSPPEVLAHVETKEVIKKEPLSESCKSLVRLTKESFKYDQEISKASAAIQVAMDKKATSMGMNDAVGWTKAAQALLDAKHDLDSALVAKANAEDGVNRLEQECNQDQSKPSN